MNFFNVLEKNAAAAAAAMNFKKNCRWRVAMDISGYLKTEEKEAATYYNWFYKLHSTNFEQISSVYLSLNFH